MNMKSILEGREGLKAVVYQIAEVTGYLLVWFCPS